MKDEILVYAESKSDAYKLLKKVFLTLEGYGRAPPNLTVEYVNIINKIKSAKRITWSDENVEMDPHLKFISTLDLGYHIAPLDFIQDPGVQNTETDVAITTDDVADIENCEPYVKKRKETPFKLQNNETIIIDDSFEALDTQYINSSDVQNTETDVAITTDDEADIENCEPYVKKRKGRPIKLQNNDTIIIDGSFEALDTQYINSAEKFKMEGRVEAANLINMGVLDPTDLNSTFVPAGKLEG